jgi:hypothetical protein
MVKKIGGNGPKVPPSVEGTKSVDSVKVGTVQKVTGPEKQRGARGTKAIGHPITSAEKQEIFRLIEEEAERMFQEGEIPKKRKDTVQAAVRMAIDASVIDGVEEKKKK